MLGSYNNIITFNNNIIIIQLPWIRMYDIVTIIIILLLYQCIWEVTVPVQSIGYRYQIARATLSTEHVSGICTNYKAIIIKHL